MKKALWEGKFMDCKWSLLEGDHPRDDESKIGGVSSVLFHGEKILLVKHTKEDRGRGFVAGHREEGETSLDTLTREAKEEAGIDKILSQEVIAHYKVESFTDPEDYGYVTIFRGVVNPKFISERTAPASEIVDQRFFSMKEIEDVFPADSVWMAVVNYALKHKRK